MTSGDENGRHPVRDTFAPKGTFTYSLILKAPGSCAVAPDIAVKKETGPATLLNTRILFKSVFHLPASRLALFAHFQKTYSPRMARMGFGYQPPNKMNLILGSPFASGQIPLPLLCAPCVLLWPKFRRSSLTSFASVQTFFPPADSLFPVCCSKPAFCKRAVRTVTAKYAKHAKGRRPDLRPTTADGASSSWPGAQPVFQPDVPYRPVPAKDPRPGSRSDAQTLSPSHILHARHYGSSPG
jgi:hypothetical protein